VPDDVRRRFVEIGRKYYFPDGARAFVDRGNRLTTRSENTEVIRSLIAIARARGWEDITVSGSERFRREAWFSAKRAGLEVRGYRPTEFEQQRLVRSAARTAREGTPSDDRARAEPAAPPRPKDRDRFIKGRLADHGRATYRHDPREPMSYFVTIETDRGERTVWGVDLERALKESLTQPKIGDEVALRGVHRDRVKVKSWSRDANGKVVASKSLETHRNRWIVEKREFFQERAAGADTVRNPTIRAQKAVKEHPELAGTYLYLKGAEEIARRRIRDPEDQRRFVDTVRAALAASVARGEPFPAVRLREREAAKGARTRAPRASDREQAPVRA
jgi:putative DNA primase/helicase